MLKIMLGFHRSNHKPTMQHKPRHKCYRKVDDLNPNAEVFPFLEDVIPNLKAELAQYLGLVAKVDLLIGESKITKLGSSIQEGNSLSAFFSCSRESSIPKGSFDTDQNQALEDYL